MKSAAVAVGLAVALAPPPAAADGGAVLATTQSQRIDIDPVYSPRLTRLQSIKLRYIGEGAEEIPVPALTRQLMPGLSATVRCRGRRSCYLEAAIEAQVTGAAGAMGFDVLIDGNPMDIAIGSVQVLTPGSYVMAQRRFMLEIGSGVHDIDVVIYGTADFSYVRHSASFGIYKK